MVLYFFRHGSAGESHSNAHADQHRTLDKEGVRQSELMGRVLAALDEKVDVIVSSPLKRARQSAKLVAQEIGFRQRVQISSALLPHASYQAFLRLLARFKEQEKLLVVGHSARLSEFLGTLISPPGPRAQVSLRKGGIAKVRWGRKGAKLQWSIHPSLLTQRADHSAHSPVGLRPRPIRSRR